MPRVDFDGLVRVWEHLRSMRWLTQMSVIGLAFLFAAAPLVACAIDPSSASQMACCVESECDAAAVNDDDCCPMGGGTQDGVTSANGQVPLAPARSSTPAVWILPVSAEAALFASTEGFGRQILARPERPIFLLVSSFLIQPHLALLGRPL